MATKSGNLKDTPPKISSWRDSDWAHRLGIGRWNPKQQSEAYIFLLLSFIGFVIFVGFPILYSLWLSFQQWNLIEPQLF